MGLSSPDFDECPLFAGIAREERAGLWACLRPVERLTQRGETLVAVGDPVDGLGVVLEGAVDVSRVDENGNRVLLTHIGAGGLFAEAFVCAGLREAPVSVTAAPYARVAFLSLPALAASCARACPAHAALIRNLVHVLARKNLQQADHLDVLSRRTIRERLLTYLSQLAGPDGRGTLPFGRAALADYIGAERSALCRELSRMQREGVLTYRGSGFKLSCPR